MNNQELNANGRVLNPNADCRACCLPFEKLETVVKAIRKVTRVFDIELTADPFNENNVMFNIVMLRDDFEKLGSVLVENADGYVC